MTTLAEHQPALISFDSDGQAVVIPVAELRAIRDGRHDVTREQAQGMARYLLEWMDDNDSL